MAKIFLNEAPDGNFYPVLDGRSDKRPSDYDEPYDYRSDPLGEMAHFSELSPDLYGCATVLVVDDESSIADLVGDVLAVAGYRVLKASNGRVGFAIARHEHPALVITDRMMPEVDGIEFVQRLHDNTATRDIPVVMMSSTRPVEYELDEPLPSTGALDRLSRKMIPGVSTLAVGDIQIGFMEKPFDIDALVDVVDTMTAEEDVALPISH